MHSSYSHAAHRFHNHCTPTSVFVLHTVYSYHFFAPNLLLAFTTGRKKMRLWRYSRSCYICRAVAMTVSANPSRSRNSPELIESLASGSNMLHTACTTWRISSTLCKSLDSRNVLINARITSPYHTGDDRIKQGSIMSSKQDNINTECTAECTAAFESDLVYAKTRHRIKI